jgi:hypothetical protein
MRVSLGLFIASLAVPAVAETVTYPVPIPTECVPLAEREHVPNVIANKYQALKAEYKLARLNRADPLVAQCKEAVERLKAAAKS